MSVLPPLTDSSPLAEVQPKHMKRTPLPHQLAALEIARMIEAGPITIVKNGVESVLTTTTGTLADKPGYGKTALALIIASLPRPANKPSVSGHVPEGGGSGGYFDTICYTSTTKPEPSLQRMQFAKNLVIVPKMLTGQWDMELGHTTLTYAVITSKIELNNLLKTYKSIDSLIMSLDVLVMSDIFFKKYQSTILHEHLLSTVWDRLFIDEFHNLRNVKGNIKSRFFWAITGTPPSPRLCPSSTVLIWSHHSFLENSFRMPPVNFKTYNVVLNGLFSRLYNVLDAEMQVLVSTGDLGRAFKRISDSTRTVVSTEVEVLESMMQDIDDKIRNLNDLIAMMESQPARLIDRRSLASFKKQLDEFTTKKRVFQNISSENKECPICMETLDDSKVTITTACGHTFCIDCIIHSMKERSICPVCRQHINDNIVVKNADTATAATTTTTVKTKDEVLQEIMSEPHGKKFLVYSGNREQLHDFQTKFSSETLRCMYPRYYKPDDIKEYVNGNVNVLFITDDLICGIDLTCTTDLVIFNQVSADKEKQLLGRCNRLGRRVSLNVHRIANQYEQ